MTAKEGLLGRKTLGIDAMALWANAMLRPTVRKDTGKEYQEYMKCLTDVSGIGTPTKDLIHFDRKRKRRKISDADWCRSYAGRTHRYDEAWGMRYDSQLRDGDGFGDGRDCGDDVSGGGSYGHDDERGGFSQRTALGSE